MFQAASPRRRDFIAMLGALPCLAAAGPAAAQVQVGEKEKTILALAGAAIGKVPTIGPFLGPIIGFMFSAEEAHDDKLRKEWEAYTNTAIDVNDVRMRQGILDGLMRLVRRIDDSLAAGHNDHIKDQWENLETRLIEEAPQFRSRADQLALPRFPMFAAAAVLHLTVLERLIALCGKTAGCNADYSRQYQKLGLSYGQAIVAERVKMLAERTAQITAVKGEAYQVAGGGGGARGGGGGGAGGGNRVYYRIMDVGKEIKYGPRQKLPSGVTTNARGHAEQDDGGKQAAWEQNLARNQQNAFHRTLLRRPDGNQWPHFW